MNLQYKGLKSTRVVFGLIGFISVTLAYVFSDVTAVQWVDFVKWTMGIYAASEVGAKTAVAIKGED